MCVANHQSPSNPSIGTPAAQPTDGRLGSPIQPQPAKPADLEEPFAFARMFLAKQAMSQKRVFATPSNVNTNYLTRGDLLNTIWVQQWVQDNCKTSLPLCAGAFVLVSSGDLHDTKSSTTDSIPWLLRQIKAVEVGQEPGEANVLLQGGGRVKASSISTAQMEDVPDHQYLCCELSELSELLQVCNIALVAWQQDVALKLKLAINRYQEDEAGMRALGDDVFKDYRQHALDNIGSIIPRKLPPLDRAGQIIKCLELNPVDAWRSNVTHKQEGRDPPQSAPWKTLPQTVMAAGQQQQAAAAGGQQQQAAGVWFRQKPCTIQLSKQQQWSVAAAAAAGGQQVGGTSAYLQQCSGGQQCKTASLLLPAGTGAGVQGSVHDAGAGRGGALGPARAAAGRQQSLLDEVFGFDEDPFADLDVPGAVVVAPDSGAAGMGDHRGWNFWVQRGNQQAAAAAGGWHRSGGRVPGTAQPGVGPGPDRASLWTGHRRHSRSPPAARQVRVTEGRGRSMGGRVDRRRSRSPPAARQVQVAEGSGRSRSRSRSRSRAGPVRVHAWGTLSFQA